MIKDKNKLMLIINGFIVISTFIVATIGVIYGAGDGQLGNLRGINYFKAFTIDSNILCALSCLIVLIFNIKNEEIPYWATLFHYVSSTAVFLTFVTVVVLLSPMQVMIGNSYLKLFKGDMFFFHLLNPVLSILEIQFLNNKHKFVVKDNFYACLPTIIYSTVYTYCVLSGRWSDFYNFTFGNKLYMVPIMLIIMNSVTYLLGFINIIIHNKMIVDE